LRGVPEYLPLLSMAGMDGFEIIDVLFGKCVDLLAETKLATRTLPEFLY